MASNFITKEEVIEIAFEKADLRTGYIKDGTIEVAELKYVRPAITEDLFNRLNQSNDNLQADEVTLKGIIKKGLAHFIGFLAIPAISVQITNTGAQRPNSLNSNQASDKQIGELRETHLSMGRAYLDEAVKYIEDNIDSFSDYYSNGSSTSSKVKVRHGIIF